MRRSPTNRAGVSKRYHITVRLVLEHLESRLPPGSILGWFWRLEPIPAALLSPLNPSNFGRSQNSRGADSKNIFPLQFRARTDNLRPSEIQGAPAGVQSIEADNQQTARLVKELARIDEIFDSLDWNSNAESEQVSSASNDSGSTWGPNDYTSPLVGSPSLPSPGNEQPVFSVSMPDLMPSSPRPFPLILGQKPVPPPVNTFSNHSQIVDNYGQLPLSFVPNRGQTDPRVQFTAAGNGYTLFLTGTQVVLSLQHRDSAGSDAMLPEPNRAALFMEMVGANPSVQPVGQHPLPGKVNYLLGNDSVRWQADIPTFGRVEFPNIYNGINLVYYGNQGRLEYDFDVAPGIDPKVISLRFAGAQHIFIDQQGNLLLQTAAGTIRQHQPILYQEDSRGRVEISGSYVPLGEDQVGFSMGPYDSAKPLVVDPVLTYSTFLGGSGTDYGYAIAADSSGEAFVAGETGSTDFPTTPGALQDSSDGNIHAFVTKLDPSGSSLVYSTYIGGTGRDRINGIAVDGAGNAYIVGRTGSQDFPVTANAFQRIFGGGMFDAFDAKLNPTGDGLVFSTFLGGSLNDAAFGVAFDTAGNSYVVGGTDSFKDFPITPNAFQYTAKNTVPFVAEVNADGSDLLYSSYIGGSSNRQRGNAIAVDTSGNFYITGQTQAIDFPTVNGFQLDYGGGYNDAFVAKFNPRLIGDASLVWSTYLGGSDDDQGLAIAVDADNCVYVAGLTASTDFPTQNPLQANLNGIDNAFLAKLNPNGDGLVFSTYLGGSGIDRATGMAIDAMDNIYLTGATSSADFPTMNPIQSSLGGGSDAFIAIVNADGGSMAFSTFLGGSGDENPPSSTVPIGGAIAVDDAGLIYVTGQTDSADFPTWNPLQSGLKGVANAFIAKLSQ